MTKDPVCGMAINEDEATATETYKGKQYHFCSTGCHSKFRADPTRYAEKD